MSAALEMKLDFLCTGIQRGTTAPDSLPPGLLQAGTDILVNDPALDIGGTTQSETSLVVVGNHVCAAWNDTGVGGLGTGFAFSPDGGATFTDGGDFPSGPSPTFDIDRGDPSLAFSVRDAAYYYAALSTVGLSLWRSMNNCQSFTYVGPITSGFDDKELIAVDNTPTSPFYGRIYVGWTDFDANRVQKVTFSNNGGLTWSPEVTLPGSGSNGLGMWPAVAPNGHAYFAFVNRSFSIGGLQDQWIYRSTNGGTTWTRMTNIGTGQLRPEDPVDSTSCGRQALNGAIRNLSSPQIAIHADASAPAGYVIHAVYPYDSDGAGADRSNVFYRRSTDAAVTWSAEVRLNDDATNTDQFFPALGVNLAGVVAASWYDRRLDPTNNYDFDRFAVVSENGGLTWRPNERVSDVSSPVSTNLPHFDELVADCYHGDYDQTVVTDAVHVLWSDDRRETESGPNPDIYFDQVSLDDDGDGVLNGADQCNGPTLVTPSRTNDNLLTPDGVTRMNQDPDGDSILTCYDLCPFFAQGPPTGENTDGDVRGNRCQCSDANLDGRVAVQDLQAINLCIFQGPMVCPAEVKARCDGNFDNMCTVQDIVAANTEIFSPGQTSICARSPFVSF